MRDIKNILKQYNKNNKIKVLDFKSEIIIENKITKWRHYFLYLEQEVHLFMQIANFESRYNNNLVMGLENEIVLNPRLWQMRKDNNILALLKFNRIENCSELIEFKRIIKENNVKYF